MDEIQVGLRRIEQKLDLILSRLDEDMSEVPLKAGAYAMMLAIIALSAVVIVLVLTAR